MYFASLFASAKLERKSFATSERNKRILDDAEGIDEFNADGKRRRRKKAYFCLRRSQSLSWFEDRITKVLERNRENGE